MKRLRKYRRRNPGRKVNNSTLVWGGIVAVLAFIAIKQSASASASKAAYNNLFNYNSGTSAS